jgi:hypothetical protein
MVYFPAEARDYTRATPPAAARPTPLARRAPGHHCCIVTALKLISAVENRCDASWSADDFDVVTIDNGECVGRVFALTSAGMGHPDWWWRFFAFPHTINAQKPFYGLAETRAAAKRAFAERWRGERF